MKNEEGGFGKRIRPTQGKENRLFNHQRQKGKTTKGDMHQGSMVHRILQLKGGKDGQVSN
jgi:hypothetical protein